MYQHNTICSAFILVNDELTNNALASAKAEAGEAEWKKGYSERACKIARAALKAAQAPYSSKLTGTLFGFSTKETKDAQGNVYHKVRIELGREDGNTDIISLDVGSEYTERLLPKLGAAVHQLGLGAQVSITCFQEQVERNGRTFFNACASLKDANGNEVKATKPHFKLADEAAKKAVDALNAAGISDRKMLNGARKSAKEQYFWGLAQKIENLCHTKEAA